ncbi:hypothetical protein ACEPAI_10022 [Sanghuangporus weigelae]
MALTFGSVASTFLHSTSTLTVSSPSSSTPSTSPTHSINPWDPGEVEGGMSVQNTSQPSSILPLGPVFGSSAVVLLAVVLTVRWKRHDTWRGVFGLGDGDGNGLGVGSPSVNGDADSSRPWLWDAHVSPREKDVEVDTYKQWLDMKPLSASYTPPMPPPYPDPSDPLTACSTRTMQNGPTALQKIISTAKNNANCTCQPMSRPNLPARRLRVSVLISMPTPPRPIPPQRSYDDRDHFQHEHDDEDDDQSGEYHSSSSSFSEIEEEKLKARTLAAEIKADRERTADLSLVLGIAEVDVYDSYE